MQNACVAKRFKNACRGLERSPVQKKRGFETWPEDKQRRRKRTERHTKRSIKVIIIT